MEQSHTHNSVTGGRAEVVVQVGTAGEVHIHQGAPPTTGAGAGAWAGAGAGADAWVRLVRDSSVWGHVPAARSTAHHRQHAAAVAAEAAALRDRLTRRTAEDPWYEPEFAGRFVRQVEWLLGEPGGPNGGPPGGPTALDLYPAEAAVLVLVPLLQQVHYLRRVELHLDARPGELDPAPCADRTRSAYRAFLGGADQLVQRARRRPDTARDVGWWLFHRWLTQHREFADSGSTAALLAELGPSVGELGDALKPGRLLPLLHGLRRGPEIGNPEYLGTLPHDDGVRSGPGPQQIRDQRAALLLSLAHTLALPSTALPPIVAEHLATPHPVDLTELKSCLDNATWGGPRDLPVLRAEGRHEAVVEALREYAARADEQLHAIRRAVHERNAPVPALPTRLSADRVTAAADVFTSHARFRADGHRVLGLAMGVQLYKDRDLAVRELYQNALDACRLRAARTAYLHRTRGGALPFDGRIRFTQGTDEDGRRYLDCTDNGIGMGDGELRGVFSRAGERFAEQPEFILERADWEHLDPPIPLHLNSRFGIGVLSYFMLADEIRVTTTRMSREGTLGPALEVAICGPEHLFRIVNTGRHRAEPGTRVRLYLRKELGAGWSVVEVLQRLLGIAEFTTVAEDGERSEEWRPWVLRAWEHRSGSEQLGLDAHGLLLHAPGPVDDGQVVWCERGGGILVDGLVTRPAIRQGVLGRTPSGLTGAVVNLRGANAPATMSVDRTTVLDDLSPTLGKLLAGAVPALLEEYGPLPDIDWLSRVAHTNAQVADLVTDHLSAAGRQLHSADLTFGTPQTGWFPWDRRLVARRPASGTPTGYAPDHVYLWRLLAHRPPEALRLLAAELPDLFRFPVRVHAAVPSDQGLLTGRSANRWSEFEVEFPQLANYAATSGLPFEALARRYVELGVAKVDLRSWQPETALAEPQLPLHLGAQVVHPSLTEPVPATFLFLLSQNGGGTVGEVSGRLRALRYHVPEEAVRLAVAAQDDPLLRSGPRSLLPSDRPVPPGYLVQAARAAGLPLRIAQERLESYGLRVQAAGRLAGLPDRDVALLSVNVDGRAPWRDQDRPLSPLALLHAAEKTGRTPAELAVRFGELGFRVPSDLPADAAPEDLLAFADPGEARLWGPHYSWFFGVHHDLPTLRKRLRVLPKYGLLPGLRVPRQFSALDRELLGGNSPLDWTGLEVGRPVPFCRVLLAARGLDETPGAVTQRLTSLGIPVTHDRLPTGLTTATALRVLRRANTYDEKISPDELDHPLQHLVETALDNDCTLRTLVGWLNGLGIPVADPAETIRAALARVPRLPDGA
ncbi:ATP-binding protein [Kitasatospora phosalacinea]|uniref:ATP-binding protein n=1 Tax=Kitasatospora phosalacinea TaxID=2065 RepID=A0ABW6GUM2_9ACTN